MRIQKAASGQPDAAFLFYWTTRFASIESWCLSGASLITLFSPYVTAVFVVCVQHKVPFSAHFFANQGSFWCNSANFPKGRWSGSLEFQKGENLK